LLYYYAIKNKVMEQKIGNFFRAFLSMLYMGLLNFFVFFGFSNHYSSGTFVLENFQEQYNSGVYQFRLISTKLIGWLYQILDKTNIDFSSYPVHFLNPDADIKLYWAFFIYTTFFAMLTLLVMNVFLNNEKITVRDPYRILILLFAATIIAISQFVIVPYDTFAYFMLVLFALVFIRFLQRKQPGLNFFLMCLFIIIGTANRETMALALSLAAALLLSERGIGKDSFWPLVVLVALFIGTYISLRIFFHASVTHDSSLFAQNFTNPKNIAGLVFGVILLILPLLMATRYEQKKFILFFYVASLPYILFCLAVGILFEVRLFVPVFLIAMLLSTFSMQHGRLN